MNSYKAAQHTTDLSTGFNQTALLLTGMRWVTGWLFFSAFWRRLILENKLDPDSLGYAGEKFNHFYPNAIFIKDTIHYLITHPETLQPFLVFFTIIEALVGLGLLFGLLTRLASLGVFILSIGILFGAGWLGSTCLDEWQIGVFGVVSGLTMLIAGSDTYSLDRLLLTKFPLLQTKKWFQYIGSGNIEFPNSNYFKWTALSIAGFSLILTLYTNQAFHGGVWGKLHNLSLKPNIVVSDISYKNNNTLLFSLYRDQGIDTYGAFIIRITIKDSTGEIVQNFNHETLSNIPKNAIHNYYISKITSGKNSLVVPLGAKAQVVFSLHNLTIGKYSMEVEDISGKVWNTPFEI
ncbi:TQO small subunit DoxD [Cytophaga aurantiaca]|uniref:TQO small subunit DoxD n=1 Tax=Cytophaga aurantiaca TaxID=29530 RepID=UPI00037CED54|nr:TQO small subunit DoxD [Cytophaga aurantiaca]